MFFTSTRQNKRINASEAIVQGISEDGGLFAPSEFPPISEQEFKRMLNASYGERAFIILKKFLNDFSDDEILKCVKGAYGNNFENSNPAPVKMLNDNLSVIELWHGPTCAFKDLALQLLPYLLTVSVKKTNPKQTTVILVATSGDTGKAALEGFRDVEGTQIMVFYPEDGVSSMQKRQMTTQEGSNVAVCAVKGNFDDCQSGVKKIFTDPEIKDALEANKLMFSSANSINWGRLVPQVVYYISSYASLVADEQISLGDTVNVVVPTGNFGNILAAYYAKKMGLPLGKLICASNINNVLTDFINTGVYDRNRKFYATTSPSMDILISSNLERLLYMLSGNDDAQIREWFGALANDGKYEVTDDIKAKIAEEFYAGYCDDEQTKATIHNIYEKYSYVCDTHTAVAVKVYEDYRKATGDTTRTLIASTASPYKFSASVLDAICPEAITEDEYAMVDKINELSKITIPESLADLKNKPVRFSGSVASAEMPEYVLGALNIK